MSDRPIVFYVPHQDDETLTMGASIEAHVRAGRAVHIVLLTNGAASGVRKVLCDQNGVCLTPEEFTEARDRELAAALGQLGVPASRIGHYRHPDGALSYTQVRGAILHNIDKFPTASHHGMSWLDASNDHITAGQALRDVCNEGLVPNYDCRFYTNQAQWSKATPPHAFITPPADTGVYRAGDEYGLWSPPIGRYGIGHRSVGWAFDALKRDPRSRYHIRG